MPKTKTSSSVKKRFKVTGSGKLLRRHAAKRATSPLRVFDVKSERVQALLADAPKIGESLCEECREHFARVREYLRAN